MQKKKLFLKVESLNHETLKATILKPRCGMHTFRYAPGSRKPSRAATSFRGCCTRGVG